MQQKKVTYCKNNTNDTATTETKGQIQDATSDRKRVMEQRKINCCNSKTTLLQQQKQKCNVRCNVTENTNTAKKYCLLKQQNKPIATELKETLDTATSLRSRSRIEAGGGG
jgi:hypothetical protein